MSQKIGSFIIDLEGKEVSSEERELLAHPLVAGIILFTRNYETPEQISHLCQQIRSTRECPLLIMVDQEGGRVQRFINGFTRLPRMALLGKLHDNDPNKAINLANDCGWLMASELIAAGVDLSLAPVLDLDKNINPAIGDRAFHSDPNTVAVLTQAFVQGMNSAGMAATGKHFPGHGSVAIDSHKATPTDHRLLQEIEQADMIPFIKLIQSGISAIMPAHIVFPQVDDLPVGYSPKWLKTILRKRLGFEGVIYSDDLNMEGANISADYSDRFKAAREAGCDFVLLCNNRRGVLQVLDNLSYSSHQLSVEKWGMLQKKSLPLMTPFQTNPRWQKTREVLDKLSNFNT